MVDETANVEAVPQEEIVLPQESAQPQETSAALESENSKEYNFQELRKSKEQLEARVAELENEARTPPPQPTDYGFSDDDLIEGKHVKKLFDEFSSLKKNIEQREMEQIPQRLESRFTDFNQVVTKENVEKLKHTEPELYQAVVSGKDLYARGVSAYKTLKMMGIGEDMASKQNKSQMEKNLSKPQSSHAASGTGALHDAARFENGLTADLRKSLQKEMAQAIKAR